MSLSFTTKSTFILLTLMLSGCLVQSDEKLGANKAPTYLLPALIKGRYNNPNNADVLVFDELAHFITQHGQLTKPYYIEGQHIVIVMKQSDREKRPDLTLSIIDDGTTLNCPSCAHLNLANLWQKTQ